MTRHTTFKFCLDPTVEQQAVLFRHAGASRFAFNQCLRMVKTGLSRRRSDPDVDVPWTGFDLINAFNRWKKSEAAGRVFAVNSYGAAEVVATGLVWRGDVRQQVFEEAAVDCGRALKAWSESRSRQRGAARVGFPRFKRKNRTVPSFRLRNSRSRGGCPAIRIGDADRKRSITLPGIGLIKVIENTRRLRMLLGKGRARILFASVTYRANRWWVSINLEAADLHPSHHHAPAVGRDQSSWVGVDLGLAAFLVAATGDGRETCRVTDAPKPLDAGLRKQRHLAKLMARKQKGSRNRRDAASRLRRHYRRVRDIRRHFLHRVSNELVKTHDRIVIEDLNVAGMLRNRRLARAISDAAWGEFARMLTYKQAWRSGEIVVADRWYPSSQICSSCRRTGDRLGLKERTFRCVHCGCSMDRDRNAAANLALWAYDHHRTPDLQAGGRATNARRRDGADQHRCVGATSPKDVGTDVRPVSAGRTDDAREGRCWTTSRRHSGTL
ncbi:IS200/IS605 family element transposase accessory protein TnpB [Nocardia cyriacigeorgica]|uniref:IS200/IS605 family element transposase accessory protein TnpB n=1 Tax=Nocardia cyriacigeorgica TaxID=135487 RepID=A0A6P1CLA4_9NOCA|nr:RNA-guided endonuclease TnpB family protein [Nocardia cyriacigeorgica]MBF6082399.1 transposase [Nocardia cyriacigeorgica]MBF6285010.1 transposase [Nocardia cyriacigeorgica]MBF6426531.1 transposase [Nocardia cyriacigeorgica]NEW32104.1 IS200/IS605 family element transposase accessory protein TnpB [Nocardia cyriacigeorgica]